MKEDEKNLIRIEKIKGRIELLDSITNTLVPKQIMDDLRWMEDRLRPYLTMEESQHKFIWSEDNHIMNPNQNQKGTLLKNSKDMPTSLQTGADDRRGTEMSTSGSSIEKFGFGMDDSDGMGCMHAGMIGASTNNQKYFEKMKGCNSLDSRVYMGEQLEPSKGYENLDALRKNVK